MVLPSSPSDMELGERRLRLGGGGGGGRHDKLQVSPAPGPHPTWFCDLTSQHDSSQRLIPAKNRNTYRTNQEMLMDAGHQQMHIKTDASLYQMSRNQEMGSCEHWPGHRDQGQPRTLQALKAAALLECPVAGFQPK